MATNNPFRLNDDQLDPFGHPTDAFFRTMEEALSEYKAIAQSHAVDATKRARMIQLINNTEILMRSGKAEEPAVRRKVNEFMDDLMAISPVAARPDMEKIRNVEDIRPRRKYWELVRISNAYHVREEGQNQTKVANGAFVFAVPASRPWEVLLGERATGGHTAITRGGDVYFAGEIIIDNGTIKEWNNDSGHYRPHTALHPQVKNLLPLAAYKKGF